MNDHPRISIVVPVFNAEHHLAGCVDSIMGQTCQDFELILLDDGSTDRSAAVARSCAERSPERIHVYSQPNMGVARTRNRGIELACGEYLCFVDADDRLDPDFCEVCLDAADWYDADVVVVGYRRVVDGRVSFTFVPDPRSSYTKYMASAVWGKLHRRSFVVANQIVFPELRFGEDMLFTVKENVCTSRVCVVPCVRYSYVATEASTSQVYMRGLVDRGPELEDLVTRLCMASAPDGEADAYDYFVAKTVAFLALHFGRLDAPSVFRQVVEGFFSIIGRHRPSALRLLPLLVGPKGERVSTRLAVVAFVVLCRINMTGAFARLYCRRQAAWESLAGPTLDDDVMAGRSGAGPAGTGRNRT